MWFQFIASCCFAIFMASIVIADMFDNDIKRESYQNWIKTYCYDLTFNEWKLIESKLPTNSQCEK